MTHTVKIIILALLSLTACDLEPGDIESDDLRSYECPEVPDNIRYQHPDPDKGEGLSCACYDQGSGGTFWQGCADSNAGCAACCNAVDAIYMGAGAGECAVEPC